MLGGTEDALTEGRADLAIGGVVPGGFLGDPLMQVRFVCAAAPSHPLHRAGRALTLDDLRQHRHLVVRDSGAQRSRSGGWLNEKRWTVTSKATSIRAACMGLGYAWYPEESIREELDSGAARAPAARGRTRALRHAVPRVRGPRHGGAGRDVAVCEILRDKVAERLRRTAALQSGPGARDDRLPSRTTPEPAP